MSTTLEAVVRALIVSLEAGVTPEVVITTHTDYTEIAKLPVVVLFYPELDNWTPNEMNEKRIDNNEDGTTTVRPPKEFKSLTFEVQIISKDLLGAGGLLRLQTNFIIWLKNNRKFTVEGITYEVHGREPQKPLFGANLSNLKRVDASLTVQGVEIDTGESSTGHQVINRIFDDGFYRI